MPLYAGHAKGKRTSSRSCYFATMGLNWFDVPVFGPLFTSTHRRLKHVPPNHQNSHCSSFFLATVYAQVLRQSMHLYENTTEDIVGIPSILCTSEVYIISQERNTSDLHRGKGVCHAAAICQDKRREINWQQLLFLYFFSVRSPPMPLYSMT